MQNINEERTQSEPLYEERVRTYGSRPASVTAGMAGMAGMTNMASMTNLRMPSARRRTYRLHVPEDLPIRLYGTAPDSIVDGPGVRFVIFVQGCPHHCPGCHNPGSHDMEGGTVSSTAELWSAIRRDPLLTGVTFSGGEPFLWAEELAEIGRAAAEVGLDVMTYTGYTYEQLLGMAEENPGVKKLLTVTNYLVDGRYEEENRDLTLRYRGSSNQRILDVTCYPNSKNAVSVKWA